MYELHNSDVHSDSYTVSYVEGSPSALEKRFYTVSVESNGDGKKGFLEIMVTGFLARRERLLFAEGKLSSREKSVRIRHLKVSPFSSEDEREEVFGKFRKIFGWVFENDGGLKERFGEFDYFADLRPNNGNSVKGV